MCQSAHEFPESRELPEGMPPLLHRTDRLGMRVRFLLHGTIDVSGLTTPKLAISIAIVILILSRTLTPAKKVAAMSFQTTFDHWKQLFAGRLLSLGQILFVFALGFFVHWIWATPEPPVEELPMPELINTVKPALKNGLVQCIPRFRRRVLVRARFAVWI